MRPSEFKIGMSVKTQASGKWYFGKVVVINVERQFIEIRWKEHGQGRYAYVDDILTRIVPNANSVQELIEMICLDNYTPTDDVLSEVLT